MNSTLTEIITHIVPIVVWALTIAITVRLIAKRQAVSVTLAWLMLIYVLPIFGILTYLILGEITLGKKHQQATQKLQPKYTEWFKQVSECHHLIRTDNTLLYRPIFELAQKQLSIPCILGNKLHILNTPQSIIQSIIEDIRQAKHSISMVFYIWSDSGSINEVMHALIEARQRGVKIRILLDSVGSHNFLYSKNYQYMVDNGIEIAEALHANIFRMFLQRIDLRQHRKIIVIDNQIAYTGSMNMVDPKFFKQDSNVGKWVDIMVRINGPVSPILNALHAWDWEIETGEEMNVTLPGCPLLPIENYNSHAVQILATGPGFPDDLMAQSLAIAIFSARKSITITSPYFVPDHTIAEALRIAALRGVEVTLILPKKNDSIMVDWASRTFFDDLLAAGVKIYTFEKGLLHTKSILVDNKLALVGTVNMDMRSFMLNFEVTMIVEDLAFANEINVLQESYIDDSSLLDYQEWIKRPVYRRIVEKIFFLFSPLL
ncbi:MAG TPA: cardiolipin synthase [Pasteurellaceae bacterium]|nr:cardiolipin synthase [Pasteurellaceae bacterium]